MLTPAQLEEFRRTGLLRLPAAVSPADTVAMRDRIWDHVKKAHGIARTDPTTWATEKITHLKSVAAHDEFDRIGTPTVRGALDDLLGTGRWPEPRKWGGRLLVTFPGRDDTAWDVPTSVWHNDFMPVQEPAGPRPVQLFVLLNEVRPQGGGTLVLAGSSRLIARYMARTGEEPHPRRIRSTLSASHPWLRELWTRHADPAVNRIHRFMVEGTDIDGIHLQVAELVGSPGDVYFMHCDTFHCTAPNCLDQPRMMATNIVGPEIRT